jgi:phenylpyruvate tautomerase PptA (4-oxalocrotonate tautomerase family)
VVLDHLDLAQQAKPAMQKRAKKKKLINTVAEVVTDKVEKTKSST